MARRACLEALTELASVAGQHRPSLPWAPEILGALLRIRGEILVEVPAATRTNAPANRSGW